MYARQYKFFFIPYLYKYQNIFQRWKKRNKYSTSCHNLILKSRVYNCLTVCHIRKYCILSLVNTQHKLKSLKKWKTSRIWRIVSGKESYWTFYIRFAVPFAIHRQRNDDASRRAAGGGVKQTCHFTFVTRGSFFAGSERHTARQSLNSYYYSRWAIGERERKRGHYRDAHSWMHSYLSRTQQR